MTKNFKENQNLDETKNLDNKQEEIDNLNKKLAENQLEIEELKMQLKQLETTANNYMNTASYYKNQAEAHKKDFDRYKERNKNIEVEANLKAKTDVAKKLIPIIDNFNSAIAVLSPDVMKGFIMIYSSLMETLKELGVVEINPRNEAFDPEKHDCIEVVETEEESNENLVEKVYKKGYMLSDTNEIVRPATVSVYKYVANWW